MVEADGLTLDGMEMLQRRRRRAAAAPDVYDAAALDLDGPDQTIGERKHNSVLAYGDNGRGHENLVRPVPQIARLRGRLTLLRLLRNPDR